MANKRLKIENLDNLQELTTEGVSSIEGGLSLGQESDLQIAPIESLPQEEPYPLTFYPTKDGKLPWCAVVL